MHSCTTEMYIAYQTLIVPLVGVRFADLYTLVALLCLTYGGFIMLGYHCACVVNSFDFYTPLYLEFSTSVLRNNNSYCGEFLWCSLHLISTRSLCFVLAITADILNSEI